MNNTKVLRFFLDNPFKDFSKKDIYTKLEMNRHSCHWAMLDLLVQSMITEKKGKPHLYHLHKDLQK